MTAPLFDEAILSFTGFKQSSKRRSGFEDGYFAHVASIGKKSDRTLTFAPRTWKTSVDVLADQLRRQGIQRVAMLSYSHGQAAATAFARYAFEIGINVDLWIACDPVYRPTWLPRMTISQVLAFKALKKEGKIKVPENIRRTVYVRQTLNKPCGHTLVASHPNQHVSCEGIIHTLRHDQIDESEIFWNLVKKELEAWTNPPKAIIVEEP